MSKWEGERGREGGGKGMKEGVRRWRWGLLRNVHTQQLLKEYFSEEDCCLHQCRHCV